MNPATLTVGTRIPSFSRTVDLANWNRYAAVNDEFVPIHMDDAAGQEAGYPTAFGMGNLHISYLGAMLRDWIGEDGHMEKLEIQFRQPSTRGIVNTACGEITAVQPDADGTLVELDVWVEDGAGQRLTPGTATVRVDSQTSI